MVTSVFLSAGKLPSLRRARRAYFIHSLKKRPAFNLTMEYPMSTPDLLVTGAGGQLGQRVLHHLTDSLKIPAGRIAAATRKPESLAAWAAQGVALRRADFDEPASLEQAFAGISRLLLISTDALDRPGHRLAQHRAAIAAAAKAGVSHVVYTSMPKPETSAVLFAPDHAGTEAALAASALPEWTVLRNNWYFENLFFSLPSAREAGTAPPARGASPISAATTWRAPPPLPWRVP